MKVESTNVQNMQGSPAIAKLPVSRRLFKIQLKVQGEWIGDREFKSIAELVRYANNYHGYSLEYNRVKYHLNRYKEYQFDRKCGEWQTRLLAVC